MRTVFLGAVISVLLIVGCQQKKASESAGVKQWQAACLKNRAETDSLFKYADWSPIPPEERASFTHLNYFKYDPSWRLILTLHRYPHPDSITIMGTKSGDLRPALRYGYFEFERDGKKCKLEVIKILPHGKYRDTHLFLGFWDETSGKETYPGGRYIDLQKLPNGKYLVDFNYAYNPYCAYSHRYSCAIPPMENRLPVAVRAGEKKYENH
jgi:uncharacterized protein (DUF1684 family)